MRALAPPGAARAAGAGHVEAEQVRQLGGGGERVGDDPPGGDGDGGAQLAVDLGEDDLAGRDGRAVEGGEALGPRDVRVRTDAAVGAGAA